MTGKPAPEAVEAVAVVIRDGWYPLDGRHKERHATAVLAFIRDAIHRDGDDADAIREALGLRTEKREGPRWERSEDGTWDIATTAQRRVVGDWQETP